MSPLGLLGDSLLGLLGIPAERVRHFMVASILAALGLCAASIAEGLYAAQHRFSARAAGIGFAIGAVLAWMYGAVTPLITTVESITVAYRAVGERPKILYVVALSAIPSIIMGFFGWYSALVEWLSRAVIAGAIAGVGIILTEVGASYIKQKPYVAGSSTLVGVLAYLVTDDLTIVIVVGVGVGTLVHHFLPQRFRFGLPEERAGERKDNDKEGGQGEFALMPFQWKDMVTVPVLIGAFSVFTLRMGTVLSYGTVNAGLADKDPELDGVMLMAGLSSLGSALMGGSPVEATPGPTGGTPQPVFSTVLYLGLMAAIALFGLIEKTGKWVPLESVAGFLVTLGILVVMPEQLPHITEGVVPGGAALVVTALTSNPFYGVVAGELMVYVQSFGVVEMEGS